MVSNRKQLPNPPNSTKSRKIHKRPEKLAAAKRMRENLKGTSKRTIKKHSQQGPSGVLQAARTQDRRIVLLDACNISHTNNRLPRFNVERLSKAIQFFVERGHAVHAIFPRFHLYTRQWDNVDRLNGLYRKNYIVTTPCKEFPNRKSQVYEDRIILAIAAKYDCAVVSNDQFRDIAGDHPDWSRVAYNQRIPFHWDSSENFVIPHSGYDVLNN
uniref:RNase NYN domain-containing protein n=1 Tax=Anopheles culicifacies TaxID=139723 RepID=A0A182MVZ1_9DIPT